MLLVLLVEPTLVNSTLRITLILLSVLEVSRVRQGVKTTQRSGAGTVRCAITGTVQHVAWSNLATTAFEAPGTDSDCRRLSGLGTLPRVE